MVELRRGSEEDYSLCYSLVDCGSSESRSGSLASIELYSWRRAKVKKQVKHRCSCGEPTSTWELCKRCKMRRDAKEAGVTTQEFRELKKEKN